MRCHLEGTFAWSQVTLYQTDPNLPQEGGIWGSELPVHSKAANCQITLALILYDEKISIMQKNKKARYQIRRILYKVEHEVISTASVVTYYIKLSRRVL